MSQTLLEQQTPKPDKDTIGISYSGGGPLFVVELGIAKAFTELGIQPKAIAGVSAGSIAGTAHALDPSTDAKGIAIAADAVAQVTDRTVKLALDQILLDAVWQREHLAAIGDNADLQPLLEDAFKELSGISQIDFSYFGRDGRPDLIVGATDRLSGRPTWFTRPGALPGTAGASSANAAVADVLIASSAIPAVFPSRHITIDSQDRLFVDGGVVSNQPLSVLALYGCGTIFSCAVGYDGEALEAPKNLVDNAMQSISILIHNSTKLEEAYVMATLGEGVVINHIHPLIPFPIKGFNFNAQVVGEVIDSACRATKDWITQQELMPRQTARST